jgi:hypothetical protein
MLLNKTTQDATEQDDTSCYWTRRHKMLLNKTTQDATEQDDTRCYWTRRHKMLLNKTESQQLKKFCPNHTQSRWTMQFCPTKKCYFSFFQTHFWGSYEEQIIIFPPISTARMQIIKTWPEFGAIYNSFNKSAAQVNTRTVRSGRGFIYCFNYQTMTSPWLCQARYWFRLVQSLSRRTKVVDSTTFPTSELRIDSLFIWNFMGELPPILLTPSILH